jgi:hypothetical protein
MLSPRFSLIVAQPLSFSFGFLITMKKSKIIYEEKSVLTARYHHPKSDDYLDYVYTIKIKNSGKNPIEMVLKFDGIPPFVGIMPPEEYTIKAASILDLYSKIIRWFKKYGYILK